MALQGATYLSSWAYQSRKLPLLWGNPRGYNMLDTGSHFYEVYETKDSGKYVAVGAIEPEFYSILLEKLGLSPPEDYPQFGVDVEKMKDVFASAFRSKTRAEWEEVFSNVDACVSPVLELDEAPLHIQNAASFRKNEFGEYEPLPSPKLSRTPAELGPSSTLPGIGEHSREILKNVLDFDDERIDSLIKNEVVFGPL